MTDIAITIDLEFDINGATAAPQRRPLGIESIRPPDHPGMGLDAILDPLEKHGFRAVFFTEVMNTHYFGLETMGSVARELHARGHELQLHLHPVWRTFADDDWQRRVASTQISAAHDDNFATLSVDEGSALLANGLECFHAWGLPRPRAFRTGNLMLSRGNYRSMAANGIELSSSLGLSGYEGEPAAAVAPTIDVVEGVLEVPVTRYDEVALGSVRRTRLYSLTGCSRTALKQVPLLGAAQGVTPLILLTHAAEFMPQIVSPGVARINAEKFRMFCDFLAADRERFDVVTIDERLEHWRADQPNQAHQLQFPLSRGLQSVIDRVIELKLHAR